MEIWKDIPSYEGLYQVSSCGRVKSLNYRRSGQEKVLKQTTDHKGYRRVMLSRNGKQKHARVHRLVAEAFIPNPNNFPQINHIDEQKYNNYVENLEYCTNKYNSNFGNRNKRIGESNKRTYQKYRTII